MITYIKAQSAEPAITFIVHKLRKQLRAGKQVLWLTAGGSNVGIAAAVARQLALENTALVTVTLTDERYGPVGHQDSNWQQLLEAGFSLPGATLYPVLNGNSREAVTRAFNDFLRTSLQARDYCFGLFGMGADGHTAGLFPDSSALATPDMATSFTGNDYERITMAPKAIEQLDSAVLYAVGKNKYVALHNLENALPLNQQPAQVLKCVPDFTIFNDYKGE